MITLPHITVKTYGGLTISDNPMFSGGGTQPKKAPVKPPKPPKKKR